MLNSEVLEVVIGLVFIFIFISVVCSAVAEWVSTALTWRSLNLRTAIRNLLNDDDGGAIVDSLLKHPLIAGLRQPKVFVFLRKREILPDYIPSRMFSVALVDTIAGTPSANTKHVDELCQALNNLPDKSLPNTLLPIINRAGDSMEDIYCALEQWFDDAMDRASGWYKRKSQLLIALLALIMTVSLNADTFMISQALWKNNVLRANILKSAEQLTQGKPSVQTTKQGTQDKSAMQTLPLPFGWSSDPDDPRCPPTDLLSWFIKLGGWIITIISVSLGTPFWFDLLNKLVSMRATGKPPVRGAQPGDKQL